MTKLSTYSALLLLMISIGSFAQGLKPSSDTIRCYGITELRKIAAVMDDAVKYQSLYNNANVKLAVKDSMMFIKDKKNESLQTEVNLNGSIIKNNNNQIQSLTGDIKKADTKIKFLKFGWGGTVIVSLAALTYVVLHH